MWAASWCLTHFMVWIHTKVHFRAAVRYLEKEVLHVCAGMVQLEWCAGHFKLIAFKRAAKSNTQPPALVLSSLYCAALL